MTICLDTGVFLQMFGRCQPFYPILRSLLDNSTKLAVSTEILLEYEEITVKLSGKDRWRDVAAFLELLNRLGAVVYVAPQYRFGVIVDDPDDNKFCDCAIAAEASFIVTEDSHFGALKSAGYKPKPITPNEFIRAHLSPIS